MLQKITNKAHTYLEKVVHPMATKLGLVVLDSSIYRVERRF